MSEKKERFVRIASKRTNNILEQLRLLGNCSNTSNYEYTNEEVKKIFNAIECELKETKMKFNSKMNKERFNL